MADMTGRTGATSPTHAPGPNHPSLTLAHSPDPDDVFMWWPLTGKIDPIAWSARADASRIEPAPVIGPAPMNTGRFAFIPIPADIETLNRRAATQADLDITALSFRAYADVQDKYVLTACGSSFGDGYGPKVIARPNEGFDAPTASQEGLSSLGGRGTGAGPLGDDVEIHCEGCLRNPDVNVAIPGRRTTAFMLLGLVLGAQSISKRAARFVEMPFEQVIPAVVRGEYQGIPIHAGLVIHEGQVTYEAAGLRLVVDVGAWWKSKTGLPLPLGANAVRRDLDERFGPGSVREVAGLLEHSIAYALERRAESVEYTMPFALANVRRGNSSDAGPTLERVSRYIDLYVNKWTVDMGDAGVDALKRLYAEGAAAGLCPPVRDITPARGV